MATLAGAGYGADGGKVSHLRGLFAVTWRVVIHFLDLLIFNRKEERSRTS